jgi:hypothetical protein
MPAGPLHDGALPVTAEEWRRYLAKYREWYLRLPASGHRSAARESVDLRPEREPADEQRVAAAEARLGVRLPPSLRGFLLASNGWGPVSAYTDRLCACEEIGWFRDTDEDFVDGMREAAEDAGLEIGEDDIFLNALSVARGEDTILLDTRSASAEGEYPAYLLHIGGGHLGEPCASFSEAIERGRAEIEFVRSRHPAGSAGE